MKRYLLLLIVMGVILGHSVISAQMPGPRLLKYSPDGNYIATAGIPGLSVWDAVSGGLLFEMTPYVGDTTIEDITWSYDSTRLAVASSDQDVRVWNVSVPEYEPGDLIAEIEWTIGFGVVTSVEWRPDADMLAIAGYGNQSPIQFWETETYTYHSRTDGGSDINDLAWNPASDLIAALPLGLEEDIEPVIFSFDPEQDSYPLCPDGCHSEQETSLAWNSTGSQLAVGYSDGNVYIVDAPSNQEVMVLETGHHVTQIAWSFDDRLLAVGSVPVNPLTIWDMTTGEHLKSIDPSSIAVDFHPDRYELASFNADTYGLVVESVSNLVGDFSLDQPLRACLLNKS